MGREVVRQNIEFGVVNLSHLALCTKKFRLCLAKSHESLKFTAVLAAPLAFVLPAHTQLLGPGIPVCSASPLLPLVPLQKAAYGFGETTRDQLEEASEKRVGVAIGPMEDVKVWSVRFTSLLSGCN